MALFRHETEKARIGRLGEEAALALLKKAGLKVVAQNWRSGSYELDLVAEGRAVLCFVEVKTRRAGSLTTPEEALTPHKIRSLQRAARAFLADSGERYDGYRVQFDLVAVAYDEEEHFTAERIEDAFDCSW